MSLYIPYVVLKNLDKKQKMVIDYSKNPCPNELSDFLKCITSKQNKTTYDCKTQYENYILCIKKYNL